MDMPIDSDSIFPSDKLTRKIASELKHPTKAKTVILTSIFLPMELFFEWYVYNTIVLYYYTHFLTSCVHLIVVAKAPMYDIRD